LLGLAGCEYGDLQRLVRQEGIEDALAALYRQGVFLTIDEFKGRRPAVRGSARLELEPGQLRNRRLAAHVAARSSGSRSAGTVVTFDLAFIRDCAVNFLLLMAARGGADWLKADWEVPGGGATFRMLKFSAAGAPPVRWFSQLDPARKELHPRYRWSARVLRWGGALARVPLPPPRYVPVDEPLEIARWMADELRSDRIPHLFTFASSAVQLCRAAFDAGIELRGAQLMLVGEPITEARLAAVRRVGAEGLPRYGTIECGPTGYGCLAPEQADEVHLLRDRMAVIQVGSAGAGQGLPGGALLLTSLRPTAPIMLLNVSMGDQAVLTRRACGCPLQGLGWVEHLHTIRSFEKLTAGGMTFADTDVVGTLEEVLPSRFGGGPTDYQLLEVEAEDGQPRLVLRVHPALGPLDEQAIVESFLSALGDDTGPRRVMELAWRQAGLLRVERAVPQITPNGKILHLHQQSVS
jgi:hypothetical protein